MSDIPYRYEPDATAAALQAEQVEQAEVDQRHPVRVRRVLSDGNVGRVRQDLVEDVVGLAPDFRPFGPEGLADGDDHQ